MVPSHLYMSLPHFYLPRERASTEPMVSHSSGSRKARQEPPGPPSVRPRCTFPPWKCTHHLRARDPKMDSQWRCFFNALLIVAYSCSVTSLGAQPSWGLSQIRYKSLISLLSINNADSCLQTALKLQTCDCKANTGLIGIFRSWTTGQCQARTFTKQFRPDRESAGFNPLT